MRNRRLAFILLAIPGTAAAADERRHAATSPAHTAPAQTTTATHEPRDHERSHDATSHRRFDDVEDEHD